MLLHVWTFYFAPFHSFLAHSVKCVLLAQIMEVSSASHGGLPSLFMGFFGQGETQVLKPIL